MYKINVWITFIIPQQVQDSFFYDMLQHALQWEALTFQTFILL